MLFPQAKSEPARIKSVQLISYDLASDMMRKMKLSPEQAELFSQSVIYPKTVVKKKKSWASAPDTSLGLLKISELLFDDETRKEMKRHEDRMKEFHDTEKRVGKLKKLTEEMDTKLKEEQQRGKEIKEYLDKKHKN